MATIYRAAEAGEVPGVVQMWSDIFGVETAFFESLLAAEPGWALDQMRVAVVNGEIVSSVHIFLRDLRDASGLGRRVGCVGSVCTRESERRKGHSGRLLEDAIDFMEEAGCAWSYLFTGVNDHYARYGWRNVPSPYRVGTVAPKGHAPSVRVIDPREAPRMAPAYQATNGIRPLTHIRPAAHWEHSVPYRYGRPNVQILAPNAPTVDAYLVIETHENKTVLLEAGWLNGAEKAAQGLFDAAREVAGAYEHAEAASELPASPEMLRMEARFMADTREGSGDAAMARGLESGFDDAEIERLFALPAAIHYRADGF